MERTAEFPGPVEAIGGMKGRRRWCLDKVTVRLDAAAPAGRLAEIVSALNAAS